MTSQENRVRVASRISNELDVRLRKFYNTSSSAIPEALELLASTKEGTDVKPDVTIEESDVGKGEFDVKPDVIIGGSDVTIGEPDVNLTSKKIVEVEGRISDYKAQVQALNLEIGRLKTVIMEAPDPMELAVTKKDNEGLRLVIEEKDRSIERLEKEVNRLDLFAHYFKNVDVKQLEAPAEQKVKKSFFTRVKEVFIPG